MTLTKNKCDLDCLNCPYNDCIKPQRDAAYYREYYKTHREAILESHKRYYERNKEKIAQKRKEQNADRNK